MTGDILVRSSILAVHTQSEGHHTPILPGASHPQRHYPLGRFKTKLPENRETIGN